MRLRDSEKFVDLLLCGKAEIEIQVLKFPSQAGYRAPVRYMSVFLKDQQVLTYVYSRRLGGSSL